MPPADTKRVAGRIRVYLVSLFGIEIVRPEQCGAKTDRRFVRGSWVFDVKVEMDLLRSAVRPLRGNMIWHQLHADAPFAGGIDNAMKTLIGVDLSAEHPGPKTALGVEICGIEHDHLSHHVHTRYLRQQRRRVRPLDRIRTHDAERGRPQTALRRGRLRCLASLAAVQLLHQLFGLRSRKCSRRPRREPRKAPPKLEAP